MIRFSRFRRGDHSGLIAPVTKEFFKKGAFPSLESASFYMLFKLMMKLRVGANWDVAFLDAVKGTSVDAVFGKLPFDIVGGARPGFVLPKVSRRDVERYIQACHARGLEFSYLL